MAWRWPNDLGATASLLEAFQHRLEPIAPTASNRPHLGASRTPQQNPLPLLDRWEVITIAPGRWAIESRLHRPKDVTFGEDQRLMHHGQGPLIMALLRDAAIRGLHRADIERITARLRYHSHCPGAAIALSIEPSPTHA